MVPSMEDRMANEVRATAALLTLASGLASFDSLATSDAEYAARRRAMVAEITAERPGAPSRFDSRVKEAMTRVRRHLFVPESKLPYAYENRPLPIGEEQTISQPYIVALMTDLLKLKKEDRVLEIGTGSGYQAAVLSELVRSVYTIEIVEPLALQARERLQHHGYRNVEVRVGDGYKGWVERAPFDAIMVTAGAPQHPQPRIYLVKPSLRRGRPVRAHGMIQELTPILGNTVRS